MFAYTGVSGLSIFFWVIELPRRGDYHRFTFGLSPGSRHTLKRELMEILIFRHFALF